MVNSKQRSNFNVTCIYCNHTFNGSAARVRAHFVGERTCGVKKCSALETIPEHFLSSLKTELVQVTEESKQRAKRRKVTELFNQSTLPSMCSGNLVKDAIAEFFLVEAIPFSKVESPYFLNMVQALSTMGRGVSLPVRQTLATTLTDQKYFEVATMVANATLDRGPSTLICDGWKNCTGDPVMPSWLTCKRGVIFRCTDNP